ncbi:ADP-glyceromanno-heptose 6-epimerase [uncultured Sulfitobacter sp.]|uniref:ADP-glyceromanno-heptose 6-epimerase n=1 Tax=uncultured Sulfitobacter sp. TaxID=191468 RepID=UPI002593137C|nr:ADP-glyceromanno-heptose 6-epimerase [uncultured Sulfitobacter sp.]
MKIVTGGAGFIGSRIVSKLNDMGDSDILVVDDLREGIKMRNLANVEIADFMDADDFLHRLKMGEDFGDIEAVFHMGACSSTTEWDGRYLMRRNYEYSKELLHWSARNNSSLIYASSASVYGDGNRGFSEDAAAEYPINMYAYSKYQFDQYVRRFLPKAKAQVVGLRFFNVYGPHEAHKGSMASVAFHANNQINDTGAIRLFGASGNNAAGEQKRDFVYVDDCADVAAWLFENPDISGVFNLGTGKAETFNVLAQSVIDWHGRGVIEYIPFPDHLKNSYQSFTEADLSNLRAAGYTAPFRDVREGVFAYLNWLNGSAAAAK